MHEETRDPVEIYVDRLNHIAEHGTVDQLAKAAGISRQALHYRAMKRLKTECPGGSTSNQGGGNAPGDQGEAVTKDTTGGSQ